MLKKSLLIVFFVFTSLACAVAGLDWSGLSERRYFYVSGAGDLGYSQDSDLDSGNFGMTRSESPGRSVSVVYKRPVVGANLGFGYAQKMFRFEHIWGYHRFEDKYISEEGGRLNDGRSNRFKVGLFTSVNTVYLDIPLHERWLPYIGLGGGFCMFDIDTVEIPTQSRPVYFSGVKHIELCGELTAGLTYKVNDHFNVFGSYVFLLTGKTFDATHASRLQSVRNHSLRLGLTYAF